MRSHSAIISCNNTMRSHSAIISCNNTMRSHSAIISCGYHKLMGDALKFMVRHIFLFMYSSILCSINSIYLSSFMSSFGKQ
jgi:hypothetical protein